MTVTRSALETRLREAEDREAHADEAFRLYLDSSARALGRGNPELRSGWEKSAADWWFQVVSWSDLASMAWKDVHRLRARLESGEPWEPFEGRGGAP